MRYQTKLRAASAAVAASLALPAVAAAHPAIYTQTVKVVKAGVTTPSSDNDLTTRVEYYIQNDGRSIILQENNGVTDSGAKSDPGQPATVAGPGMTNFKQLPSAYRGNTAVFPNKASWLDYAPAHSDVQLHATCTGVPALGDKGNVVAWQGDPFFQYIPWQKDSAGLGDDPSKWIAEVKSLYPTIDLNALSTVQDFTNACTSIGGAYHPADAVVTTPASAASATVADAVAPVQAAKLASDQAAAAAQASQRTVESQLAAVQGQLSAAQASLAKLLPATTALKLTVSKKPTAKTLRTAGVGVTLTGPALGLGSVRVLVSELQARKLGLTSRVLGTRAVTFTSDGTATTTVKPTATAAAALKRRKGALTVTVDVFSGQRTTAVTTKLA